MFACDSAKFHLQAAWPKLSLEPLAPEGLVDSAALISRTKHRRIDTALSPVAHMPFPPLKRSSDATAELYVFLTLLY